MESGWIETVRIIIELIAIVFIPVVGYTLRGVISQGRKIEMIEQKVNDQISSRIERLERKIESFDSKIEQKLDRLESNLNAKIDIMTSVLSNYTNNKKKE